MDKVCGIYKIQSRKYPDRCYIGSTVNLQQRWYTHKKQLRHNYHHSPSLQAHFNKYGIDDLEFSIITICDKSCLIPINNVVMIEQFYLLLYAHEKHDMKRPYFNAYSIAGSSLGYKHSEETKEKHRRLMIGKKIALGTILSSEAKELIRQAQILINQNPEVRRNKSEKMKGKVPWNKGKTTPEETKRKISESLIGRPKSSFLKTIIS